MIVDTKSLPKQVQKQLREVEVIESEIEEYLFKHPKRGQQPIIIHPPFVWFCADNAGLLGEQIRVYTDAVGKKARGNKRIGKPSLYADLVKHFMLLKRHGITLPRNKSLSQKACMHGLGEILRRHKCTDLSDNLIMKNGIYRNKIASKMDRVFSRIANAIENTPA